MEMQHSRTALLLEEAGLALLREKRVAIFGVGGVGGFVCEALARVGVGALDLFDKDVIDESNLNRQIIALHSTVGQAKVEVMKKRIQDINPACAVRANKVFYLPENAAEFPLEAYDYVVDAVDTVSAKLEIVVRSKQVGVPVISSMGAANKLYPERFEIADIAKTTVDPLARIMRLELRKRGIKGVKVVYSKEQPRVVKVHADKDEKQCSQAQNKKSTLGSVSFVPAAAGLLLAGEVVRDLTGIC